MNAEPVRWPRVNQLLEEVMSRWETREGRKGLPGIHAFHCDSPADLSMDSSIGARFIDQGVPAEETNLIIALRKGFGSIPRMPMNGPFLRPDEIQEVASWIDAGMPD